MSTTPADANARRALGALGVLSLVMLGVRFYAATRVGFGDSEALYAAYALHPQPAYLDHPGLVGLLARVIGGGTAPSPLAAHQITAVLSTAFPWLVVLACRAAGATLVRAAVAGLVLALVPELAVGLFAMTPDLLLAFAWMGALALAAAGLRAVPGSARATVAFATAGVLAGVATAAKVSGLGLLLALSAAYATRPARRHGRTVAPWAGLVAGLLVVVPIATFEARAGWPMLRHRLLDTQVGAGPSFRNLGALLGGQLVYLSPVVAWLVVRAVRDAWRGRGDAVGALLLATFLVPIGPLVFLCGWSRVAEPHWIAPALLSLAIVSARAPVAPARRVLAVSVAVEAVLVAAVHVWTLVPAAVALAPASYDARLDLTNELYGWKDVVDVARLRAFQASGEDTGRDGVVVAGPHWVICAQLDAALQGTWRVGCDTPVRDDYDDWFPRARWTNADVIVWVSDARFEWTDAPSFAPLLATHTPLGYSEVKIDRAGRNVRRFRITILSRRAGV